MMDYQALFVLSGLALAGAGLPLALGRVSPNHWYGLRTPRTLGDPQVWYPANAHAGRLLLVLGVGVAGAALLLPRLWPEMAAETYVWGMTAVLLGGLLAVLLLSLRHARAL